jgi:DNA-binding winged helix-turn-helix (wHTH) protein
LRPRTRELFKLGVRIRLRPQPAQILDLLLMRAGDVVTREELRRLLWPVHSEVDFNYGVNTSIKELRSALGDSAAEPRYIETIPKLGYRLVTPVESGEARQPVAAAAAPEPTPVPNTGSDQVTQARAVSVSRRSAAALGASLAAGCALLAWLLWPRAPTAPPAATGRLMVAVLPFVHDP